MRLQETYSVVSPALRIYFVYHLSRSISLYQFISLYSLYGWDISGGEDQPNLAAHVLRHVRVEGNVSINDTRLSMYDDSGMITCSSLSLVWGKIATFRKMRLPVALELLELLATVNIPQPDRLVVRPTDKQGGIRRIETDAIYITAAIFSNVSFTGTTLRLSPPESTPLPR